MTEVLLRYIVKKNLDKIKLEIDLLRDSLRNIFVVMFGIMSGEITLFYRLFKSFNYLDLIMFILGLFFIILSVKIRNQKQKEIKNLLEQIGE